MGAVIRVSTSTGLALVLAACGSRDSNVELPTVSLTPTTSLPPVETSAACTWAASLGGNPGDETLLAWPVQTVQKTWTLHNDGTCDWSGVTLVLVAPSEQGMSQSVPVPKTAAQSSIEMALDLTTPLRLGEYSGEWRLRAPDGTLFGPALRINLTVQAYPPATPPSPFGVLTQAGCVLDAAFVQDVMLADGTVVQPGAALQKIWRVQNTGTCDWQVGSSLVFIAGDTMGIENAVTIPPTRSGEIADIQLDLTAPTQQGTHTGWWRLQSTDGTIFGALLFIQVNVQTSAAAANDAATDTPYSPFIHNISYHSRQIFLDGQAKGNQANVFTKVGDSITDVPAFLNPIGDGNYALNDYAYLQPAIGYFSEAAVRAGNAFNNKSLAAVWGWSSFDVLNPDRVADTCPGLTPLECEYSSVKPSVAIILIGTNDALSKTDPSIYEGNLRRIVEISIANGVIPVLSTVPYSQFVDVQPYNQVIITTAIAFDVPWMDFYGATWDLANHGISWEDGVHPSVPGTHDPTNFTPDNLKYGHTVRNLLVLHVLDALWRQVLAY